MTRTSIRTGTATALLLLAACGGSSAADVSETAGTPPTEATVPENGAPANLKLGKISLFQGVEAVLSFEGNPPVKVQPSIVVGRDALVRVFVDPDDGFDNRDVTATLTVTAPGADDLVLSDTRKVRRSSDDADLDSTFNFELSGDDLTEDTEFVVELTDEVGGGDPGATRWDSAEDLPGGLDTQVTDELNLVLVPIQYDADGSGRLPDTSQAQVDAIADLMYATYPAHAVTVRVAAPLPWSQTVNGFNPLGWQRLLDEISTLRGEADEPENTYYYGLFDPTDTFDEHCSAGCILGLSSPGVNTTNPSLRSSIGVGFPDVAAETLVHEVGHAHGRFHAPCGGALGADRDYPHEDASIGSWGYDLVTGELKDPASYTDIMGYCELQWVSNYTYFHLMDRIVTLAAQEAQPPALPSRRPITRLLTDGTGYLERAPRTSQVADPSTGGEAVRLDLIDADGRPAGTTEGWLYPYDHLPGGVILLDHVLPEGITPVLAD
jgi:hypothetical protein